MNLDKVRANDLAWVRAFLFTAIRDHAHLDWIDPLAYLDSGDGYILHDGDDIAAVAVLPNDPTGAIWCRAFYHARNVPLEAVWGEFWTKFLEGPQTEGTVIGIMELNKALHSTMFELGFTAATEVVYLQKPLTKVDLSDEQDMAISKLTPDMARLVEEIDKVCFPPLWRFPYASIEKGLSVPGVCTKISDGKNIVGYQISNFGYSNLHLARLAVLPQARGNGYARRLVQDLFQTAIRNFIFNVSVNTQSDNDSSLRLYKSLGFELGTQKVSILTYEFN